MYLQKEMKKKYKCNDNAPVVGPLIAHVVVVPFVLIMVGVLVAVLVVASLESAHTNICITNKGVSKLGAFSIHKFK